MDEVEKLVREIEDQFRDQAMQASQNMDLVQAKEELPRDLEALLEGLEPLGRLLGLLEPALRRCLGP